MKEKVSEFFSSGTSIKMSAVQRDYKWDADKAIGLLENIQRGDAFLAAVSYRQEGDTEIISAYNRPNSIAKMGYFRY